MKKTSSVITYVLIVICALIYCQEVLLSHSLTINFNVLLSLGSTVPLSLIQPFSIKSLLIMVFNLINNWRLWSAMFLHASLMHITMNMMFLFFIGKIAEPLFGHIRFLILFLLTGFIGDLASAVIGRSYSVGASTALFGLLLSGWIIARHFHANDLARSLMGLFVVNIIFDLISPGISLWGHLGGALAGICLGWVLRPREDKRFLSSLWVELPLSLLVTVVLCGLIIAF